MSWTLGSVPYVNAVPLVHGFEQSPDVTVRYEVPSRLPELLMTDQCQAILVSSVDSFLNPERRIAEGICIGSFGKVESVRLFSKVPFRQIKRLALDLSSMTSNRLAQVLLAESFGVRPWVSAERPSLSQMLATHDAAVLIGDIGMEADGTGLNVLDLGEAWTELTGLPFVWAAWQGHEGLTPELVRRLVEAVPASFLESRIAVPLGGGRPEAGKADGVIEAAQRRSGWTEAATRLYLLETMHFAMDSKMKEGLAMFRKLLLANGFGDCRYTPGFVTGQ